MSSLQLSPRWRKVMRDLWTNRTRAALVVLCLLVGVFTVSFLINSQSILRTAIDRQFAAARPSNATFTVPDGFDQNFVQQVRRQPEIQDAEGLRSTIVRLKVGPNQWIPLAISAFRDFRDLRIDQVHPYSGAWPPAKGQILLERDSLRLAAMPDLTVGQTLTVQAADGQQSTLTFAGTAYDFNRTPSPGTGVAYGYVTLDTVERLGEPAQMNQLSIIVSGATHKSDKDRVIQVANRVKDQFENDGKTVAAIQVPDPGQHPLGTVMDAMGIALGALSVVTLVGGGLLVFNTIFALLAQQVRQIGMMKAIGARGDQLLTMYLAMIMVLGVLALAIATPLALVGGIAFARFLASMSNLDINDVQMPIQAFAVEALIGLGVPFFAAMYPIWSGTRVTVREALADYGLAKNGSKPSLLDRVLKGLRVPLFRRPVVLSLRNMFRRRARLVLTLLPLALSGALFITAINVRASLVQEVDNIFGLRGYGLNILFEQPYPVAKIETLASNLPGVTAVELYWQTTDAYRLRADGSETSALPVVGIRPTESIFRLPVVAGRWLFAQDPGVAVVNDGFLRDEPDIRVGDLVQFRINGRKIPLRVVGVVQEKMSPSKVYVNDGYYQKLMGDLGRANGLWVATASGEPAENFKKAFEAQFEQADMRISTMNTISDERSFIDFHFNIIIVPLGIAAVLLALVGGLGLTGTMSTNVLERQRETGVMRAIGASDGSVQQVFLVEGLFIGLLSWLLGIALALPVTALVDVQVGNALLYAPLVDVFSLGGALTWLFIEMVTAVLSCYWPARNAAQTSVRTLLAYE